MVQNLETMGIRDPGANIYPCGSLGLSGTAKISGTIKAPRAKVEYYIVTAKYNVTDASISAGENFFGAMTRHSLGDKAGQKLLNIESNEMAELSKFTVGFQTGRYLDADPTTATDTYAYAVIKGPFQLSAMIDPEFFFEVNPAGEWATCSAFTVEISVVAVLSDIQTGRGVFIDRQYFPTSTKHTVLGLGAGLVESVWLKNGSSAYNTSRIEVDYGDSVTKVDFMRPWELAGAASALLMAAQTTTMYIENLDVPVTPRRNIVVTNGTTDTLLILTRSLVSA